MKHERGGTPKFNMLLRRGLAVLAVGAAVMTGCGTEEYDYVARSNQPVTVNCPPKMTITGQELKDADDAKLRFDSLACNRAVEKAVSLLKLYRKSVKDGTMSPNESPGPDNTYIVRVATIISEDQVRFKADEHGKPDYSRLAGIQTNYGVVGADGFSDVHNTEVGIIDFDPEHGWTVSFDREPKGNDTGEHYYVSSGYFTPTQSDNFQQNLSDTSTALLKML